MLLESDDLIFIGNAELVLLNPYLPTLFERLGVLAETDKGPRIVDADAMSRGVYLLYLVDGRLDAPEPELVLNKLPCGPPTAQPVAASITPSETDFVMCDGLIAGVIANWPWQHLTCRAARDMSPAPGAARGTVRIAST